MRRLGYRSDNERMEAVAGAALQPAPLTSPLAAGLDAAAQTGLALAQKERAAWENEQHYAAMAAMDRISSELEEEIQAGNLLDEAAVKQALDERREDYLNRMDPQARRLVQPRLAGVNDYQQIGLRKALRKKRGEIEAASLNASIEQFKKAAIDAPDDAAAALEIEKIDGAIGGAAGTLIDEDRARALKTAHADEIWIERFKPLMENPNADAAALEKWARSKNISIEARQHLLDAIKGEVRDRRRGQFAELSAGWMNDYIAAPFAERPKLYENIEKARAGFKAYFGDEEWAKTGAMFWSAAREEAAYHDAWDKGGDPDFVLSHIEAYGLDAQPKRTIRNSLEKWNAYQEELTQRREERAQAEAAQKMTQDLGLRLLDLRQREADYKQYSLGQWPEGEAIPEPVAGQQYYAEMTRILTAAATLSEKGIDASGLRGLYDQAQANYARLTEDAQALELARAQYGRVTLDQKNADLLYMERARAGLDANGIVDFLRTGGTIPKPLKDEMESSVDIINPEKIRAYAPLIQKAAADAPALWSQMKDAAAAVYQEFHPDMSDQEIVDRAKTAMKVLTPEETKARTAALQTNQGVKERSKWFADNIDLRGADAEWVRRDLQKRGIVLPEGRLPNPLDMEQAPEMVAYFEERLRARYLPSSRGNMMDAQRMALADVLQKYSLWPEQGNLHWMKRSPMLYIPDQTWLEKQLQADLKARGIETFLSSDYFVKENLYPQTGYQEPANIFKEKKNIKVNQKPYPILYVDSNTENDSIPKYFISIIDPMTGVVDTVRDEKNLPLQWGGEELLTRYKAYQNAGSILKKMDIINFDKFLNSRLSIIQEKEFPKVR